MVLKRDAMSLDYSSFEHVKMRAPVGVLGMRAL